MMNSFIKPGMMLLLWLMAMTMHGSTADPVTLPAAEETLKVLFSKISGNNPDDQNKQLTDTIIQLLENTLNFPGSFEYPFEKLSTLGKITSADKKIRIITWNLPFKDGTNLFFGFLLYKPGKNGPVKVFALNDRSEEINDPSVQELNVENWYGCLVYAVVENNLSDGTCYTLLGYDPGNLSVSRRVVDVLWFNSNLEPVFGKPIFLYNKLVVNRLLLHYSAKVRMSLTWNDSMNMIVFDHLSPSLPMYTGNFQYYGPDFTYDALKFEKGRWVLLENVDIRNKEK